MLDDLFQAYNRPAAPGAAVGVFAEGAGRVVQGYGWADLEGEVPCSAETNFRLASLTKQFTAMAILMLTQDGALSLDESLTEIFPGFPQYGRSVKVRHLLTHTSGVPDYEELIPAGTTLPLSDRDVLQLLLAQSQGYFPPGGRYRYSNSGYALLALTVELRSGYRFPWFLKKWIFEPLGMGATVAYEPGVSVVPYRAYGYSPSGLTFARTDQSLTSFVLGDGGIYSSVAELAKWDQALYTERLVGQELREQAFAAAVTTDLPETGYGFGWLVGRYRGLKEVWHYGETIGFTTRIARWPEKRLTVVVLANRSQADLSGLVHAIADRFLFA